MNERKFIHLQNNFIIDGSKLKAARDLTILLSCNEDNIINVLAYFNAYPQASIRSGKLYQLPEGDRILWNSSN